MKNVKVEIANNCEHCFCRFVVLWAPTGVPGAYFLVDLCPKTALRKFTIVASSQRATKTAIRKFTIVASLQRANATAIRKLTLRPYSGLMKPPSEN